MAREHKLDNNRSALLEAARETEPKAQVAKIANLANLAKHRASKPAPVDEDAVDESADLYVETDVPGARAANSLITKVMTFYEKLDPAFTAWMASDPSEEVTIAVFDALYACANELRRRAFQPLKIRRRAIAKICNAYRKRFGVPYGVLDDELLRLMEVSLETGIDQLVEIKKIREIEHNESGTASRKSSSAPRSPPRLSRT